MGWRSCRSTRTPFNRFIYIWKPTQKHPLLPVGSHCHVHSLPHRLHHVHSSNVHERTSIPVRAFPLSQRDVGTQNVIEPNAGSVWPIGTQQLLIWYPSIKLNNARSPLLRDTSNLPSDPSQIINLIGQIILGFNESSSLNLDFSEYFLKIITNIGQLSP